MANLVIILPCILAALLLLRVLFLPMKLLWKLVLNGICGVLLLGLVNLTAGLSGFSLPVNPVTAVVAGGLGLPGILLLGVFQLFF